MKNKKLQYLKTFIQAVFFIGYGLGLIYGFMKIWGVTLMLILLTSGIIGNFFCGWVCPFGALQEWIGRIGNKFIKKKFRMPSKLQSVVKYSKYILFILILAGILDFISAFNSNHTFLSIIGAQSNNTISIAAWCFLLFFIFSAIFFDRPFCNYFCLNSVKYGLLSFMRIFTIKRNVDKCANCKRCSNVCPMQIDVAEIKNLRHANCINCMKCIDSCPIKNTLQYGLCIKSFSTSKTAKQ